MFLSVSVKWRCGLVCFNFWYGIALFYLCRCLLQEEDLCQEVEKEKTSSRKNNKQTSKSKRDRDKKKDKKRRKQERDRAKFKYVRVFQFKFERKLRSRSLKTAYIMYFVSSVDGKILMSDIKKFPIIITKVVNFEAMILRIQNNILFFHVIITQILIPSEIRILAGSCADNKNEKFRLSLSSSPVTDLSIPWKVSSL